MTLPQGWKTVKLGDVLPPEAIEAVRKIADSGSANAPDFLKVLEPHRKYLLAKGVLPEYLAYVLEFQFGQERR